MLVSSVAEAESYLPAPVGLCLPANTPSTVSSFHFRFRYCNYDILLGLISIDEMTSFVSFLFIKY
jgi:hypothetical protein